MPKIILKSKLKMSTQSAQKLFWDIKRWQAIWDPIHKVELIYDDSFHQEFLMGLFWNGSMQTIRTVRFCEPNKIVFFSPSPPPPMSYHTGSWSFTSLSEQNTLITLEREYNISIFSNEKTTAFQKRLDIFHNQFIDRLSLLLDSFAEVNYETL
jgi:hypothetical protein